MTFAVPGARTQRSVIWANLLCLLSVLAWCAGLPATKDLVAAIPPLPLTMLRMAVAGTILVALWVAREGTGPLRRANWGQGVIVGAVAMGVGGLGMTIALDLTDAVTVAIITAAMPIIGLTFEVMFDGRRVTAALLIGVALGIGGGIVALDLGRATPELGWGALASLVSVFGYVWGSRATVKRFPDLSALGRTAITVAGAGIAIGVLALAQMAWAGSGIRWELIGPRTVGSLFFSAVVAVVVAQTLWIVAVERVGIGVAAMHNNAGPFYVMVIMLALGGIWNWTQAAGAAIVILGVLVAQDMLGRRAWSV
jgi:drug/metabolite transporter (DMT)-like permease